MKKFFENLRFIFMPSYWILNYHYSKEVDDLVNDLLDKFEFTDYDGFNAMLGGVWVWCENTPFSAMTIYNPGYNIRVPGRPSRLTIYRGLKKLKTHIDLKKSQEIQKIREIAFSK
jgi:hypothetical protein